MFRVAVLAAAVILAGCSASQLQATSTAATNAIQEGQLVCATATAAGPLVVALADTAGAPVKATNATSAFVNDGGFGSRMPSPPQSSGEVSASEAHAIGLMGVDPAAFAKAKAAHDAKNGAGA